MMFKGKNTFGDFLNSEEKIATNILADRLSLLESAGIISKHKHPDSKAKVLYKLTEKGVDLVPVLVDIIEWSEKYHTVHPLAKEFSSQLRKDKPGVLRTLYRDLKSR